MKSTIQSQLAISAYAHYNIVFVGHGLGGALASIGGWAARNTYIDKRVSPFFRAHDLD